VHDECTKFNPALLLGMQACVNSLSGNTFNTHAPKNQWRLLHWQAAMSAVITMPPFSFV
jgi:hypothetical protein